MTHPEEQPENIEDAAVENPDAAGAPEVTEQTEAEAPAEPQVEELTEDLQRVTAEYANYRRRSARERQAAVEAARASVVSSLLPIVDDLALAKQHGDLEEGPLKAFAEKFRSTLDSLGVTAFGEPGEAFDPEVHEAVQDSSSGDEKVLGTVLRQGYRLGDRTIRNAMVMIADPGEDTAEG
ncbi:nucleotide exchange factor GrpE [Corynebacterium oculi]|uniref:Protein GrpE n=1 Tax=Corynebacterium oculi TaxID=1544416 RepID=A0A0Q0TWK4_9CORY|nr:nucleotide exchange factor GrpE [Corynebacterium oculi]KQB83276.1 Protein GrpE [Corynebacterium oculi]